VRAFSPPSVGRFVAAVHHRAPPAADAGEAFVTNDPNSPQAHAAIERISEFVRRELTQAALVFGSGLTLAFLRGRVGSDSGALSSARVSFPRIA
jgi:hypothetical protein